MGEKNRTHDMIALGLVMQAEGGSGIHFLITELAKRCAYASAQIQDF